MKGGGDGKLELSLQHEQQRQEFLIHLTFMLVLRKTQKSDDLGETIYAEAVPCSGCRR